MLHPDFSSRVWEAEGCLAVRKLPVALHAAADHGASGTFSAANSVVVPWCLLSWVMVPQRPGLSPLPHLLTLGGPYRPYQASLFLRTAGSGRVGSTSLSWHVQPRQNTIAIRLDPVGRPAG
jgi:hypothetical protein